MVRIDLGDPALPQETVIGTLAFPWAYAGDDRRPASTAETATSAIAAGPDGKLYIGGFSEQRVQRVGTVTIGDGAHPAVLRLRSSAPIPVAVLSDYAFDAASVVPSSVAVAGARARGKSELRDVDCDGRKDLVVGIGPHFTPNQLAGGLIQRPPVDGNRVIRPNSRLIRYPFPPVPFSDAGELDFRVAR